MQIRACAIALVPVLGLGLTACSTAMRESAASSSRAMKTDAAVRGADSEGAGGVAPGSPARVAGGSTSLPALDAMAAARRLVRTGSVSVEVEDVDAASRRMEAIAGDHGGYVSNVQATRDEGSRRSSVVTVRLEPTGFMKALAEVRALGIVKAETVQVEDIGKAYADVEARIASKQAAAARMREIMATRTGSLEDVIAADGQLSSILEELEQLEGQRRYYDQSMGLSTLTVALGTKDVPQVAGRERIAVLAPIAEAVRQGERHLVAMAALAAYLAVVLGPWLLLAALAVLLVGRVRRRMTARAT